MHDFAAIPYTTCVFCGISPEICNLPEVISCLISEFGQSVYQMLCFLHVKLLVDEVIATATFKYQLLRKIWIKAIFNHCQLFFQQFSQDSRVTFGICGNDIIQSHHEIVLPPSDQSTVEK